MKIVESQEGGFSNLADGTNGFTMHADHITLSESDWDYMPKNSRKLLAEYLNPYLEKWEYEEIIP